MKIKEICANAICKGTETNYEIEDVITSSWCPARWLPLIRMTCSSGSNKCESCYNQEYTKGLRDED